MIGQIFSQLVSSGTQLLSQVASQALQFGQQELSKPHNQAHIVKAIGEICKDIKK